MTVDGEDKSNVGAGVVDKICGIENGNGKVGTFVDNWYGSKDREGKGVDKRWGVEDVDNLYGVEVDAGDRDVGVDVVDNCDVAGVNLHMQTFFAGEHLFSKIPWK